MYVLSNKGYMFEFAVLAQGTTLELPNHKNTSKQNMEVDGDRESYVPSPAPAHLLSVPTSSASSTLLPHQISAPSPASASASSAFEFSREATSSPLVRPAVQRLDPERIAVDSYFIVIFYFMFKNVLMIVQDRWLQLFSDLLEIFLLHRILVHLLL
jgi:hypothetical protein